MTHPLAEFEIQGINIKCFDEGGSGFFHFAPISVIIGKNNAGKSTVVDLIDICIERLSGDLTRPAQRRQGFDPAIDIRITPSESTLKGQFKTTQGGGFIREPNHWEFGKHFLNDPPVWRYVGAGEPELVDGYAFQTTDSKLMQFVTPKLRSLNNWSLQNSTLLRVMAERSVIPEVYGNSIPQPNGVGITNLIRDFINNDAQPRDVVEIDLLRDLNAIYAGDSEFTSIICQENDESRRWEIFLREVGKDDVRLSESGSSLQSVFIILSYFRLVPLLRKTAWDSLILAIEEPENNLHPALLRRLISFLAERRQALGFSLVLTTHSPVCIDWATGRDDATIIHVTRNGAGSKCRNVMDYDGHTNILDDLDVRGSDILQSNGIIWVEGPSDRVYLRRWIDLVSGNTLVEGSHYTFMYYGGKILSHFEAVPETELSTLISMVTLNRNVAILMDSDRKKSVDSTRKPPMRLNKTKMRLRNEISNRGGFSWVTAGKEIENYIPLSVWQRLIGPDFKLPDEFTDIPRLTQVKAVKSTKVELAHKVGEVMRVEDLEGHLDLKSQLDRLVGHIRRWNSLG